LYLLQENQKQIKKCEEKGILLPVLLRTTNIKSVLFFNDIQINVVL